MTLSRRLLVVLLTAVVFTALVVAMAAEWRVREALAPIGFERQLGTLRLARRILVDEADRARIDVQAALIAPHAAALSARATDQAPGDSELAQITLTFRALLLSHADHLQLRLIDAKGDEVIRVERSAAGGAISQVPTVGLQNKRNRPYFRNAMALDPGEVALSPIELNQEFGQVQVPHLPVLRSAAPVHDSEGRKLGIVVLNVDMRHALERVRTAGSPGDAIHLLDAQGGALLHPDRTLEFGRDLGRPRDLRSELPGPRTMEASAEPFTGTIDAGAGSVLALAVLTVRDAAAGPLLLYSTRPTAASRIAPAVRQATVWAALTAALLASGVALLLSRAVTRPLKAMTDAAQGLLDDPRAPLPSNVGVGELAVLAEALARMRSSLHERDEARAREQALLRDMLEAVPSAIVTVDADRRITMANVSAERLFGRPRASLVGQSIESLMPERYRDAHPALVAGYQRQPTTRPMGAGRELFALRDDGQEVPVEIGLSPIDSSQGRLTLASITDISERKASETLRARLAAIVETSDDAILSKTPASIVTSWNQGATRLLGYTEPEMIGRSVLSVVPEALTDEEAELTGRLLRGEHIAHYETRRRHRDGREIDVSVTLSPIYAQGVVVGISSIMRDITKARQMATELQRSNAELSQFAYVASHDLQEPLRTVANYTELLAERYRGKLDEKADKYIHYATDGARRMQRLVTDLLAYSRVGSQGKPLVPVDSAAVVELVLQSLRLRMKETGGRVELGELPWVMADEVQLQQLFQNLIGNALKFRGEAPPVVQVRARRQDAFWRFEVVDNGIGLDTRYADRIFQMFQRLHAVGKYEGSGIGLSIAKRIVERHGGTIGVESQPGQGATFHFTLAAARSPD